MQQTLLTYLQKITTNTEQNLVQEFPLNDLSVDGRFAHVLLYRWQLRAAVLGIYPTKQSRGLNVQIPGQVDPMYVPQETVDTIRRKVLEKVEQAAQSLKNLLEDRLDLRMPHIECFETLDEDKSTPNFEWEKGKLLLFEDVACQVSYDLGCYHFYKENYQEAKEDFCKASSLFPKLQNPVMCQVEEAKLKGYCQACGIITPIVSTPESLQERLVTSVKEGFKDLVKLLQEDNIKREISLPIRSEIQLEVLKKMGSQSRLYREVSVCNIVSEVLDGKMAWNCPSEFFLGEDREKFLCECLKPLVTTKQMVNLNAFLRILSELYPGVKATLKKEGILSQLNLELEDPEHEHFPAEPVVPASIPEGSLSGVGHLEGELLAARDPNTIITLVSQIQSAPGSRPLWSINYKWELSKSLTNMLKGMPAGLQRDRLYVYVSKATELKGIKLFAQARQLFRLVEEETRAMLPWLSSAVNWELLHLDLTEILETKGNCDFFRQEVIQQTSACVRAFLRDKDTPPRRDLVELCAVTLLNLQEWELLCQIETRRDGTLQFASLLGSICRDICTNKAGRFTATGFWNSVLPMFGRVGTVYQQKRLSSGTAKDVQRDGILSRLSFMALVQKIKNSLVLTVILSFLTKVYNILKDDCNSEVSLEYGELWPTVIERQDDYSQTPVIECLQATLLHALTAYPNHHYWLKTQGDVLFAQGHYSATLKNYLSAAVVTTDYFSQLLPQGIFDDQLIGKMIVCCTKLHCHTQAAVLCQYQEEVNYTTAFRALSERYCNDSCDTFYQHIWDVSLLEYLVNQHVRRGDVERRRTLLRLMGNLELNINNNEEIQHEAANIRKGRFLRALAHQYL
ncbi:integrator complex subunit 8 isoform X2 [Tachypleus tridentatus]